MVITKYDAYWIFPIIIGLTGFFGVFYIISSIVMLGDELSSDSLSSDWWYGLLFLIPGLILLFFSLLFLYLLIRIIKPKDKKFKESPSERNRKIRDLFLAHGAKVICSFCGKTFKKALSYCSYCGARITITKDEILAHGAKAICPICGKIFKKTRTHCSHCGAKITIYMNEIG